MRLIDIEDMALLKTVSCGGLSAKKLWKRIKEQPTIDAVEVVRCKDCNRSDWYKTLNGEYRCYCMEHGSSGHTDDDYCSYGERQESEVEE